jgi:hypothetical protein
MLIVKALIILIVLKMKISYFNNDKKNPLSLFKGSKNQFIKKGVKQF